jgi:hypothetical protein
MNEARKERQAQPVGVIDPKERNVPRVADSNRMREAV